MFETIKSVFNLNDRLNNKKQLINITAGLSKKLNLNNFTNLTNPDEILSRGRIEPKQLIETYNDPQVTSAFGLRKSQVQKLKWDVDRGVENEGITNLVRDLVNTWNMPQLISGIIDARAWGFSVFEYYWLQEGSFLNIKFVVQKPSYWFEFDNNAGLKFMASNSGTGINCSTSKFLLVQNNATYDNPYGTSLLSKCYWLVKFKKDTIKLWAKFIEKYGMPHLVGKGLNTTEELVNSFVDMLDNLKQDGVAVIGSDETIEKLAGNDLSSKEIYESFVAFLDAQISKVILNHASAMDAIQGQLGNTSKAISTLDVLALSDKELVECSINQIIKLYVKINFGDIKHIPKFEMYEVADVDLDLANRDKILADAGVGFTKEYWLKAYGFADTDIELTSAPKGAMFSESETKINNIVNEMFSPFLDILDKGLDFEEVKKELYNKFNNISDAEVEAVMSKLMLQATKGV